MVNSANNRVEEDKNDVEKNFKVSKNLTLIGFLIRVKQFTSYVVMFQNSNFIDLSPIMKQILISNFQWILTEVFNRDATLDPFPSKECEGNMILRDIKRPADFDSRAEITETFNICTTLK